MEDSKKKIIIFDMDGVLFDTIPFSRQEFMETHPGVTGEMYNEMHSGNFHQEAAKYSHLRPPESEEEKEKRYRDYAEQKSKSKLFAGMKELLIELHDSGFILALNTNAHERNTMPLLKSSGIENLFDFIATAETTIDKVKKFQIITKKYRVAAEDMLFVTDALGDLRDADMAGIPTVAVTWGVHDNANFKREKHPNLKGIASTVLGLKQIIQGLA